MGIVITFLGLIKDQLKYSIEIGDETFDYSTGLGWLQSTRPNVEREKFKPLGLSGFNKETLIKIARAVKPFGRLTTNDVEYLSQVYIRLPNEKDVLECLYSDADCGALSFSEFCDDLGYDHDSISALNTYMACEKTAKKIRQLESKKLISRPICES